MALRSVQDAHARSRTRVPNTQALVVGTRNNEPAVKLYARQASAVADKIPDATARVHVPQFNRAVARGAGDKVAMQVNRVNGSMVSFQSATQFADSLRFVGAQRPYFDCAIFGARNDGCFIESYVQYGVGVSL